MSELTGEVWLSSPEKRRHDIRVAALMLPLGALAVTAGSIALFAGGTRDPFFSQPRLGQDEELFNIYKLRTLTGGDQSDASLGASDPRATRVGRLLRSLAADEMPQLINILKGDMAAVGPRPLVMHDIELTREVLDADDYAEWQNARRIARPGFMSSFGNESKTLPPQSEEYLRRRAELDIEYAQTASRAGDNAIVRSALRIPMTASVPHGSAIAIPEAGQEAA
jgi:lipopolysaccharide/colanic/teichoic acid biosynthesis glycosyltransferase